MNRDYVIRSRYLVSGEGWKVEEVTLSNVDYETAGRAASKRAHELNAIYADSKGWDWNVTVTNPTTGDAYFELFKGRLS